MSLFQQPNLTSGLDDAIVTTSQSVSAFPIMILVFVWMIIFIGGSSNQKRKIGSADYPFWAVLGGISISFLSLIFTLGQGIIDIITLGVVFSVTILCGIWFFLSKVRGEI